MAPERMGQELATYFPPEPQGASSCQRNVATRQMTRVACGAQSDHPGSHSPTNGQSDLRVQSRCSNSPPSFRGSPFDTLDPPLHIASEKQAPDQRAKYRFARLQTSREAPHSSQRTRFSIFRCKDLLLDRLILLHCQLVQPVNQTVGSFCSVLFTLRKFQGNLAHV